MTPTEQLTELEALALSLRFSASEGDLAAAAKLDKIEPDIVRLQLEVEMAREQEIDQLERSLL